MTRRLGGLLVPAFVIMGAVSIASAAFSDDDPIVAFAPLLVAAVLFGIWKLPLRSSLLLLFTAILCIDSPYEVPHAGMWEDPLAPFSHFIYGNLHQLTGIAILHFSGLDLMLAELFVVAIYRQLTQSKVDGGPTTPLPRALKYALFVSFCTCAFLEVMGIVRGGDAGQSLWQIRQLIFIAPICALYTFSIRGPSDFRAFGSAVLFSAVFKALLGGYFLHFVAHAQQLTPPYTTNHTDSVLFISAVMVAITLWLEAPTVQHAALIVATVPIILYGVVINDRRLAWVSLAACLFTVFAMMPRNRAKRFLMKAAVLALPLAAAYLAVGWSSHSKVFKPVQVIRSVVASDAGSDEQADSSTEFRNMENYNLYATWLPNPLFGSGFGHEYNEVILLPDISKFFPAYRYVPHNSVLWLWGIGGYVGWSALWMFLVIGVFMTARGYHQTVDPVARTGGLVCLCVVVCFLNQAFGDMGTQSWESVFLLCPAMVLGGKLAVSVGAWRVSSASRLAAVRAAVFARGPRVVA